MSVDVMVGCYDSGGVFHCSECLHPGDAFRLAYVSDVFGRQAVCAGCGVDVLGTRLGCVPSLVIFGLDEVLYGVHRLAFAEHVAYDDGERVLCLACGVNGQWVIAPAPLYVRDLIDGGNLDPAGWVCECCGCNLAEQSDGGHCEGFAVVYDDGSEADYFVSPSLDECERVAHEWLGSWVGDAMHEGVSLMLGVYRATLPVRSFNRIMNPVDDLSWWDVSNVAELVTALAGVVCPVCGRLFPIDAVTSSGLCEMCECSAS
jgi:hypothetical protein